MTTNQFQTCQNQLLGTPSLPSYYLTFELADGQPIKMDKRPPKNLTNPQRISRFEYEQKIKTGLVMVYDQKKHEFLEKDPITGTQLPSIRVISENVIASS